MSTTQQQNRLTNAEFRELTNGLSIPSSQLSETQLSLRVRATEEGYINEGFNILNPLGLARLLRIHALPKEAPEKNTLADAVQVAIFRKNDYADFADAAESGALYPIVLPQGKETSLEHMQMLYSAIRVTADSMSHDPDAFDVVIYDGHQHEIITERLSRDVLAEIQRVQAKDTLSSMLRRKTAEPENSPGSTLVLHRAHDYGKDPVAIERAALDGALRNLPINMDSLSEGLNEDSLRMLSVFENAVQTAASCLDGNSNVLIAVEANPSPYLPAVYITLPELMEAYTVTGLNPEQPHAVHQPLSQVIATVMSQRERNDRAMLSQIVVDFSEKAVDLFVKLAQEEPDLKRDDVIYMIDQHAPSELGQNSAALLFNVLTQSSIAALREQSDAVVPSIKQQLTQAMIARMSAHITAIKENQPKNSHEKPCVASPDEEKMTRSATAFSRY